MCGPTHKMRAVQVQVQARRQSDAGDETHSCGDDPGVEAHTAAQGAATELWKPPRRRPSEARKAARKPKGASESVKVGAICETMY